MIQTPDNIYFYNTRKSNSQFLYFRIDESFSQDAPLHAMLMLKYWDIGIGKFRIAYESTIPNNQASESGDGYVRITPWIQHYNQRDWRETACPLDNMSLARKTTRLRGADLRIETQSKLRLDSIQLSTPNEAQIERYFTIPSYLNSVRNNQSRSLNRNEIITKIPVKLPPR